uniref:Uncharacterized protein n=1 Tax=Panagrolaimus sp. PS1159 TaxID=55785 RepID=A0AC35GNH3_9BILA
MTFYCIVNVIVFSDKVTVYKLHGMPNNETELFRKSMFEVQYLFCLDIIIIIWGAYLSAVCLTVYMCTNDALCQEYKNFLKKLQSRVNDRSVMKVEIIESIEAQFIDYLKLAKFINENILKIWGICFIIGVFSYLISQFCLKNFGDFLGKDKATFVIWLITSICLLGVAVNTPATFSSLIIETIDIFYLDHGIWRECTDEKVKSVVRDILSRLKDADYGSKGVSFGSAGTILFNLILIVIPFVVNLLSPYAVMPMPLKDL